MPFISVIITAHNRRELLLEAVNSALNQTLPKDEYEIIVVKNSRAIQGSFANCNISLGLDLFNEGITEYI